MVFIHFELSMIYIYIYMYIYIYIYIINTYIYKYIILNRDFNASLLTGFYLTNLLTVIKECR